LSLPDKVKVEKRVQDLGNTEQKGIVQDVVVPIVQAGVGGYVAGKVGQGKKPKK
jgi:hypothetical protein